MGTGDWNDGMNRVGAGGKGESVWVGWFLLTILGPLRRAARDSASEADAPSATFQGRGSPARGRIETNRLGRRLVSTWLF